MIIGIDIDDTLVKTNEKALEIIKREELNTVNYYEELDDLPSFIVKHFKEIVKTAKLYDGSKEVVSYLRSKGHRVIFVTSRATIGGADTEEDTVNYLVKNGIEYDNIYLARHNKLAVCLKENVDIFIDDKEKTLEPLAKAGITCLKMTSIDKGDSKFIKVSNWQEIKNELDKII